MQEVILIIHLVLAIALVVVILMQRSEGGAASLTGGGGDGGGMGGFMTARGSANFLTRLTTMLAVAFICTSLALAVLAGQGRETESLMDDLPQDTPAPVVPAAPAAPSVPFSD